MACGLDHLGLYHLVLFRGLGTAWSREPSLLEALPANEQAAEMIRQFVTEALVTRVAGALGVPPLRVTAAASQLIGLAMVRHLIGVEPLASADEEEIVRLVAPTIQRYLDGD